MAAPDLPALCSLEEYLKQDYDFVIVGGGTARLAVAARLSQNPSWQVGVLEAGAANLFDPMIMVPALCYQTPGNPQYDWAHKTVPQSMEGKQGISFTIGAQRPLSVGSCHIISDNPEDDPAIDPAYISHPADAEVLAKGIELGEKMRTTNPFSDKIEKRIFPPENVDLGIKQNRLEYVKTAVSTQYHPIGTVAMGPEGQGACDERLRVRGCKGLRVVDASIIPLHVSGNIVSTVYAIAEKGADLIKGDWSL